MNQEVKKYEGVVKYLIEKEFYKHHNMLKSVLSYEKEDLFQVARMAVFNALSTYDSKKEVQEKTYVCCCVRNDLKSLLKKASLKKSQHSDVDLEKTVISEPERISKESVLNSLLKKKLSKVQFYLYKLYREGYTQSEICKIGERIGINSWDMVVIEDKIRKIASGF